MRRTRRATAAVVVAVAGLLVSSQAATVASAEDCADVDELGIEIVAYCATFDVTADEAEAQLALQPVVHDAIDEATELAGDRIVLAESERGDELGVHVVVTAGEPLPELEAYVDGLEVAGEVEYVDVPSAADGDAVTERLVADGLDDLEAVQGVRYDGATGTVIVDASEALEAADVDALTATAEAGGAALDVQVSAGQGGDARAGGLDALFSSTYCTQGLTIVATDGTLRTTTAGHCPNSTWRYESSDASHSNPVTYMGQRRTPAADIQWGTTGLAPLPYVWGATGTGWTTVTSTVDRADSLGDLVCHRGATTGYSCGVVSSITYRPTWDNACNGVTCAATWVQVTGDELACAGGDSGGPIFAGSAAYGFLKGAWYSGTGRGECDWLVYMPQDALSEIGPAVHVALG